MYTHLVVPVDGSEESFRSLPVAASLARSFEAPPLLLGAWGDVRKRDMAIRIQEAADRAFGGTAYDVTLQRHDRPVASIIRDVAATFERPLLCMTTRGRGRSAAVLGSVVAETLDLVTDPAVLIGPECTAQPPASGQTLLICSDGTAFSDSILLHAEQFAVNLELRPDVITVHDPKDIETARRTLGSALVNSVSEAAHVRELSEQVSTATGAEAGFDVLHEASPERAILDYARVTNTGLIAMATHDEYRLRRITAGSVTANVVRRAACPVLTFRPRGDQH